MSSQHSPANSSRSALKYSVIPILALLAFASPPQVAGQDQTVNGNLNVSGKIQAADLNLGTNGPSVKSALASRAPLSGLVFDGTAGAIMSGIPAFNARDFTLSMWVNPATFANAPRLISQSASSSFQLFIDTNGIPTMFIGGLGGGSARGPSAVTAGKYVLITATRTAGVCRVYVDAIAGATATFKANLLGPVDTLGGNGTSKFSGTIAGLLVYNRALSDAEILALYETGVAPAGDYCNAITQLITADDSTFASDTGFWTQTATTISGGVATLGSAGYILRPGLLVAGMHYRAMVTIKAISGTVNFGDTSAVGQFDSFTTPGFQTVEFTASSSSDHFAVGVTNGSTATVDDITLIPLGLVGAWDFSHLQPTSTSAPAMPGVNCGPLTWSTGVKPSVPWSGTLPGNVTVGGNLAVNGTFSASNYAASDGTVTGSSTAGLTLSAGGTNQNVTIAPTGTGSTLIGGKVGIGTYGGVPEVITRSGPNAPLDIFGTDITPSSNTAAASILRLNRDVLGSGGYRKHSAVDFMLSRWADLDNHPYTRFDLRLSGAPNDYSDPSIDVATFRSDGRVGIGTTTPTAKLDVAGDTKIQGNLNVSGTVTSGGDSGLMLSAGGTNQNITLAPTGAGGTIINGKVAIGKATPTTALDVAGTVSATEAIVGDGGKHIVSSPWFCSETTTYGYIKLVTPIEERERNMFTLRITGYRYAYGADTFTIQASGYAYSGNPVGSGLINTRVQTEGTDLPVELGTETRDGRNLIVLRIGTPSTSWYHPNLSFEYRGWIAKAASDFQWVVNETSPAPAGNTNNVVIRDDTGPSYFNAGDIGIGTTEPADKLDVKTGENRYFRVGTMNNNGQPADFATGGVYAGLSRPSDGSIVGGMFTYVTAAQKSNFALSSRNDVIFLAGTGGLGQSPERMRITDEGNIGIGTTMPGAKLDVIGQIRSTGGLAYQGSDGGPWWINGTANGPAVMLQQHSAAGGPANRRGSLGWMDNNGVKSEFMTWTDSGNIGIGTSGPTNTLDIRNNGAADNLSWGSAASIYGHIRYDAATATANIYSAGGTKLSLGSNSLSHVVIDTSGNVGIGVGSPAHKLHISNSGDVALAFTDRASASAKNAYISFQNGLLKFGTAGDNWFGTNHLVVTHAGNVGIGTENPRQKLDVVGGQIRMSDFGDNVIESAQGGSVYPLIGTYAGWRSNTVYIAGYNAANLPAYAKTNSVSIGGNGIERVWVDLLTGNIGIGTTAPAAKLDVAGNAKITGTLDATSSGSFGGNLNLTNAQGNNWAIKNDGGNFALSTTSTGGGATPLKFDRATQAATFGGAVKLGDNAWSLSQSGSAFYLSGTAGTALTIDSSRKARFEGAIESAGTATFSGKVTASSDLIVNAPGRVGINTTSPTRALEVNGAPLFVLNNASEQFTLRFPQTQYGALRFQNEWYVTQGGTGWGAEIRTQDIGGGGGNLVFMTSPTDQGANVQPIARMEIKADGNVVMNGNVGIGTAATAGAKLSVEGLIRAREVVVDPASVQWADYVFADGYRNAPLSEVEAQIKEHKHLPGVPSAKEVADKGVNIGQMQAVLLQKIEELTLHMIEQEKQMKTQDERIERLERENAQLRQNSR